MIEELIKQLPTATPFFVLVAGFVIGLFHAFEPDHVVAVATQNVKSTQKSSLSFFSTDWLRRYQKLNSKCIVRGWTKVNKRSDMFLFK